jgi:DNA adenine methylase
MTSVTARIASPIKWHGGKFYLANEIVSLMPPHLHYVEPYAGGLSVLLARNPEGVSEVANDLNGWLTNFWAVLQDPKLFSDLCRRLEATPFGEDFFSKAQDAVSSAASPEGIDSVEAAAAFFVHCRQSLAGRMKAFAPLSRSRTRRGMNEQASAWLTAIEGLPLVHERLARVVVLNGEALDVIRREDGPNTLFYLDPPYVPATRASSDTYGEYEMTAQQHEQLLDVVLACEGKVMISGYACELYDKRLNAWRRHDFDRPNNAAGGDSKRRMTEVVWCNFP